MDQKHWTIKGHTRLPDKDYVAGSRRMLAWKNPNGMVVWIEDIFKHFAYGEIRPPANTKEEALQTYDIKCLGEYIDNRTTS